jgi:superoxide dismutase, Fe-Mn family
MAGKQESRRKFLILSAQTGLALSSSASLPTVFQSCSPPQKNSGSQIIQETSLDQSPLGYDYGSLEPVIDARTMEIHYSKHAAAYSQNLKEAAAAEGIKAGTSVEEILSKISGYTTKMRNNGGGHFNHELFWKCMASPGEGKPSGKFFTEIEAAFGAFDNFKSQFSDAAKNRFGSGWAWLYLDQSKKLKIGSTPNQDNPLMDIAEIKGTPLLGLDVWEHAYYLKYQNRRPEYIENWWKVVNWPLVQKRYEALL